MKGGKRERERERERTNHNNNINNKKDNLNSYLHITRTKLTQSILIRKNINISEVEEKSTINSTQEQ